MSAQQPPTLTRGVDESRVKTRDVSIDLHVCRAHPLTELRLYDPSEVVDRLM